MVTITVSKENGHVKYQFHSRITWIYVSVTFFVLAIPIIPLIIIAGRLGEPDSLGCLILLISLVILFGWIMVHFVKQYNDIIIDLKLNKVMLINNLPVWKWLINRRVYACNDLDGFQFVKRREASRTGSGADVYYLMMLVKGRRMKELKVMTFDQYPSGMDFYIEELNAMVFNGTV